MPSALHILTSSNLHTNAGKLKCNAYEEVEALREKLTYLSHKIVALYPTADYCSLNLHMECVHLGC